MSHQRSESSTPVLKLIKKSSSEPAAHSPSPPCANGSVPSLELRHDYVDVETEDNLKMDEEEEDYSYNEDVSSVRAVGSGQGAYSMGTECLDSGILLRQGIWGTPVSPPVVPVSEESCAPSKVLASSRTTPGGSAAHSDGQSPVTGISTNISTMMDFR